MPICAFLSMDSLRHYVSDDALVEPHLRSMGWDLEWLSWRQAHHWQHYDKVVVRSTWDYQEDPHLFLELLRQIEKAGIPLFNSASLIEWNLEKNYLQEIQKQGVAIVPTLFESRWVKKDFFRELETSEIVVKPLISASAQDTFRISQPEFPSLLPKLKALFSNRAFMVQPFREAIVEEGEYSLSYFGEAYSHAILKKPKDQDFRVQEEHGGYIQAVNPSMELRSLAQKVLKALPELPLYSRLDFVRNPRGHFEIMEIELIEPSMYLRFDSEAPKRFADAIVRTSY